MTEDLAETRHHHGPAGGGDDRHREDERVDSSEGAQDQASMTPARGSGSSRVTILARIDHVRILHVRDFM